METKSSLPWQPLLVVSALFFGTGAAFCQPQQLSSPLITQVKVDRAGQKTLVSVTGSSALAYRTMRLSGPQRLVLDFPGARLARLPSSVPAPFPPIYGVRTGQFKPDVARVVIDLEQVVPYRVRSEANGVTVEFNVDASASLRGAPVPAPPSQAPHLARARPAGKYAPAPRAVAAPNSIPRSNPSFPSLPRAAVPPGGPSPESQAAPFDTSFKNGMLTFRAQYESLRSVLRRIGDQAGVSVYFAEDLGKEQISVEFQHYRLDEALRQILNRYDVFFLYGEGQGILGSPGLQAVWVYGAGSGLALRPMPEITTAKETAPIQAGSDIGPHAEVFSGPKGSDSIAEALRALKDPNGDVREHALSQASVVKAKLPQETLVNLALADESDKVRLVALRSLPLDPDLRWVAERAAGDLSQPVSQAAQEILRALDLRERAKTWAGQTQKPPVP